MKTITVPNPLGKSPGNKVYGYGYLQGIASERPTWMMLSVQGYYPLPTVGHYYHPTTHSECTLTNQWR